MSICSSPHSWLRRVTFTAYTAYFVSGTGISLNTSAERILSRPLCSATTPYTNGMATGSNTHHSTYMHHTAFVHARCMLVCDLYTSLDEAAEEFVHIDYDVEPEEVDVRPESVPKEDDQRAAIELPQ